MAVTDAIHKRRVVGNSREVFIDVTGPASYTTGGEVMTIAQQKKWMPETAAALSAVDFTKGNSFFDSQRNADGVECLLDRTNNKILFWSAAGTQVANATNLSAVTVRVRFIYDISNG